MISLELGPEPLILKAKGVKWCEEYRNTLESGAEPRHRYRRDDIRDALRVETNGKCAYCESRIEHISFAHIEHFIPKSARPDLVYTWKNLTLACERCNNYKGDYFSEESPLLNPYEDNVSEAVTFYGPMAIDRTDRAMLTISKLRLNRSELLFRREENLRGVLKILDLLARTPGNADLQTALIEELSDRLLDHAEYASCSRCFSRDEAPRRCATNRAALDVILVLTLVKVSEEANT